MAEGLVLRSGVTIRVGDTGVTYPLQIIDEDGSAVDITGLTVSGLLRKPDGTQVEQSGSITDPTAGKFTITFPTPSASDVGVWRIQARRTDGGSLDRATEAGEQYVGPRL